MKVFLFEQQTPEWWAIRRGIPTASEAANIITPATGNLSRGSTKYINRLIADLLDPNYPRLSSMPTSAAITEGIRREPESRRYYELERRCTVTEVGFVLHDSGQFGCSPDSLVGAVIDGSGQVAGAVGVLELKNPEPATHVGYLRAKVLPPEYRPQCHFHLLATGLPWVDFMSYVPGFDALIVRVEPDDYTRMLSKALGEFLGELQDAQAMILGRPKPVYVPGPEPVMPELSEQLEAEIEEARRKLHEM